MPVSIFLSLVHEAVIFNHIVFSMYMYAMTMKTMPINSQVNA